MWLEVVSRFFVPLSRGFPELLRNIFLTLVATLTLASIAHATSPYSTDVSAAGLTSKLLSATPRATSPEREAIRAVTVKTRIYGQGVVEGSFTIRRNKTWSSTFESGGRRWEDPIVPVLLQGRVTIGGRARRGESQRDQPVALSIINKKLKVTFLGRPIGSKQRQRLYTIHAPLSGSPVFAASVKGIPASAQRRGSCGTSVEDINGHRADTETGPIVTSSVAQPAVRVATISTDADPEWFATYGAESNAEIARAIHIAESIFYRDFRVRLSIVKQHTYTNTSPYVATHGAELLQQFASNPANPLNLGDNPATFSSDVDLKHLFTGKDLDGTTIGVAYIGALCAAPDLAYGVTQHFIRDATFGIFAHEIGHNFGAAHDLKSPRTIMYPTMSIPPSAQFSERSLFAVRSFIDRYGRCLSTQTSPAPTPPAMEEPEEPSFDWSVSFTRRIRANGRPIIRFSGSVIGPDLTPADGLGVSLKRDGVTIASTTTNGTGRYTFNIPARTFLRRLATMQAATNDGHGESQIIHVSPSAIKRALADR